MTNDSENSSDRNEIAPDPTYVPAAVAMAITLMVWGILTHWVMSLAGVSLLTWALWKWMNEICNQWRRQDEQ